MRRLLSVVCLAGAALLTASTEPAKPEFGAFGIDTQAADTSVRAGDDFYRRINGHWLDTTPIPADKPYYSDALRLYELNRDRTRGVLEDAAQAPKDAEERKLGDLYATFLDQPGIDARGIAPIKPDLKRIARIRKPRDLAVLMGALQQSATPDYFGMPQSILPIDFDVGVDPKQPTRYLTGIDQGGLGLPDREYYASDDADMAKAREAYKAYLAAIFTAAGFSNAPMRADRVIALETRIAATHWRRADLRDIDKTYNPMTPADLAKAAPGFDWIAYLAAAGVDPAATVIVGEPSAMAGFAALVPATPIAVWRDYLAARWIGDAAQVLPQPIVDADFAFRDKALAGIPEQTPRWKRAVSFTGRSMGKAVGKRYAARYFPAESKARIEAMVAGIRAAMARRIEALAWMTPATKARAETKLANLLVDVGYPQIWTDYAGLEVVRGDAYGNLRRTNAFEAARRRAQLGRPVDRREWRSWANPQTVNAFNTGPLNKLIFPAGFLQPPIFDPAADPAVNYGAIGSVIGHEISHSFDDQGAKLDETGALSNWWTPVDVAAFKKATDALAAQMSAYAPLPGLHIDGRLTLGESTADLAGLLVSLDAYHASLKGKRAPVIGGMTGDQRFFAAFAQGWRELQREADLRQQLATDPHAPGRFRVMTVRNVDAWYAAFGVKAGERMALAPGARVRIW